MQIAKYYGADSHRGMQHQKPGSGEIAGRGSPSIDYTQEDVTKNGKTYDVIVDTVCGKASFARYKNRSHPTDSIWRLRAGCVRWVQTLWTSNAAAKKSSAAWEAKTQQDLEFLTELAAAGHLKPFIDKRIPSNRLPTPTATRIPGANAAMS